MCGIFGIIVQHTSNSNASSSNEVAKFTVLGLHALQHRGQEAAGITTFDEKEMAFHTKYTLGKVGDYFNKEPVLHTLCGGSAIGHVRYSTSGDRVTHATQSHVQPLFVEINHGGFALVHNGNLINAPALQKELKKQGKIFHTSIDTEVIIHLMSHKPYDSLAEQLQYALRKVQGAFSLIVLSDQGLIGIRDPYGIRPLILGKTENSMILASETCALDIINAQYIRDIEPGEMITITPYALWSEFPFERRDPRFCIFEYVYFARPDSHLEGITVYQARKEIGKVLAQEEAFVEDADMVVPVPDSGVPAALGYAQENGIPFELGIIRNHYVGRTFIEPTQHIRNFGLKLKHNVNQDVVKGKSIVLIDDSLVRGNTMKKIIQMLRSVQVKEIHVRISSPPIQHSCFYGIDTPKQSELFAYNYTVEEIRKIMQVDSLQFLSLQGLHSIFKQKYQKKQRFCDACFSGCHPIPLPSRAPYASYAF